LPLTEGCTIGATRAATSVGNNPDASSTTRRIFETIDATVYDASIRRWKARGVVSDDVHCTYKCLRWMNPKDMNNRNILTTIAQTYDGGPPPSGACPTILAKRRRTVPNAVSNKIQPTRVANIDTRLSNTTVLSDMYPQIMQQSVDDTSRTSVSSEFVPHVIAITNIMMLAVTEYSTHRIQLLPSSTSFW
jgi:hypothetical protein